MSETIGTFQALRDRQLSQGLRTLSVAGFFVLLISLSRVLTIGWHAVMALHITIYLVILIITVLGRRLPYSTRAAIIVAIPFVLGTAGLFSWGLASLGIPALFTCCVLATMFFGGRAGIIASASSTLVIGAVGLLVSAGVLVFNFDPRLYLASHTAWIAAMVAMAVVAGLIMMVLGELNSEIESLVRTLQNRNQEMSNMIRQLKTEMAERARAEEERRILEDRLQHARRMEDLGTLAAGVAHDLNNVLAGAVSYPDLLLARLPADSVLREPIETIRRSGVKAAAIVQDLLTLARRGMASARVVNLNDVITDYFSSLEYDRLKSFHPHVDVRIKLDQALPGILGSPIHLLKIVMNLVSNAAEAMPNGGVITVSTCNERTSARAGALGEIEAGNYTLLTVSDTGVGISRDDTKKIFEPFFTKKVMGRSGTGLGMAVVWGVVKDHKGHIDIKSTMGQGTTFTLYFPVTKEKEDQTRHAEHGTERLGKGESILIVDDVKEQREIAAKMLHELGYSVDALPSGEEAIAYLKGSSTDLLILDMCMEPGMDGLDTYRQILKEHPRQKAIITSGYAETRRVKEAQKLGAGPYMRKPFRMDDIGAAIRRELDR